jgi:hypothetical protein
MRKTMTARAIATNTPFPISRHKLNESAILLSAWRIAVWGRLVALVVQIAVVGRVGLLGARKKSD